MNKLNVRKTKKAVEKGWEYVKSLKGRRKLYDAATLEAILMQLEEALNGNYKTTEQKYFCIANEIESDFNWRIKLLVHKGLDMEPNEYKIFWSILEEVLQDYTGEDYILTEDDMELA